MWYLAGSVLDTKTGITKYVPLLLDKKHWKDMKGIRYHKNTGVCLLGGRLVLQIDTVIPIVFTHKGIVKNTKRDKYWGGHKVFLTPLGSKTYMTDENEFYCKGSGFLLERHQGFEFKQSKQSYKYLSLYSVEALFPHMAYTMVCKERHHG